MSKRNDIIDGRQSNLKYGLIYTEVLGWIDLGHAQGTDIISLLRSIDAGESSGGVATVRPWSDVHSGIVGIVSADGSYIDKARGGRLPYA